MKKKTTKKQRDYVAILTIYGWQKEVKPKTLIKWLRNTANALENTPNDISQTVYKARLMK